MKQEPTPTERLVAGVMTGTSIDGVDAALALLSGPPEARQATLLNHVHRPLGPLAEELRAYANGEAITAHDLNVLSHGLGVACADAVAEAAGTDRPDLVALHGQTVLHQPPHSVAIVDPWPTAIRFSCPVVTDLRAMDVAHGGQGAPMTPIADAVMFGQANEAFDIINLGGFCNITRLNPDAEGDPITGFDVCACNQILDEAARQLLQQPWDEDGAVAARGHADTTLVSHVETVLAPTSTRSMGTGDEGHEALTLLAHLSSADQLATLVAAIARRIASRIPGAHPIHLFGGGVHNSTLVQALRTACPNRAVTVGHPKCPPDAREALAMAVLGDRAANGQPITWTSLTGANMINQTPHRAGRWICTKDGNE